MTLRITTLSMTMKFHDTQPNDTLNNNTQKDNKNSLTLSIMTLRITTLSMTMKYHDTQHNDTQNNNTQKDNKNSLTLSIMTLRITKLLWQRNSMTLSITTLRITTLSMTIKFHDTQNSNTKNENEIP